MQTFILLLVLGGLVAGAILFVIFAVVIRGVRDALVPEDEITRLDALKRIERADPDLVRPVAGRRSTSHRADSSAARRV